MNYFAHAIRFLDCPYFLSGLAIPDWLSVVDRKVRVRQKTVALKFASLTGDDAQIAAGILQHLEDDRWFHATPGFFACMGEIGRAFRSVLAEDDQWRCGFLGHIVTEMLLDACLIERYPDRLVQYYEMLGRVDGGRVERLVNEVATARTSRLSDLVPRFIEERFLDDYPDDQAFLRRLNQVMRRIGLPALPESTTAVISQGRESIRARVEELLPRDLFGLIAL